MRGEPGSSACEQVHDRRQRLLVHVHERRCVLGGLLGPGDHERDRLAGVDDLVAGERLEAPLRTGTDERKVARRQDRDDARDLERGRAIDPTDAGMGMHGGDDPRVQQALQRRSRRTGSRR